MMRSLATVVGVAGCTVLAMKLIEANQLGNYLLLAAAFLAVNFTFWFGTKSRWRMLNAGRSLLYVSLSISFVLVQNSLSVFLGSEYPGRGVLRVLMYSAICFSFIGLNWTLWQIQRRDPSLVQGPVSRYLSQKQLDSLHTGRGSSEGDAPDDDPSMEGSRII